MDKISPSRILKNDGTPSDIPVASTANVYSRSHYMGRGTVFALAYRAKSETGTPDVDLYLQQTHVKPEDGGSTYESTEDVTNGWFQTATKIADITDETWHHIVITPLAFPYLRFFLDGQGSNPADCTVEMHLCQLESD